MTAYYQLLLASLTLSILPHYQHIHPVLFVFYLLVASIFIALKYYQYRPSRPLLIRLLLQWQQPLKLILLCINLVLLLVFFGYHFSQQAAIALFISMLVLKLLEIQHTGDQRNLSVFLFLQFFLLATSFLFSQSIFQFLYVLGVYGLIFFVLLSDHNQPFQQKQFWVIATYMGRLVMMSLPLIIVLFLFFPRIPGPLWVLPNLSAKSTTGLSDTMHPGSVNQLSDSDEIVFRIDFLDSIPTAEQLYWRGPVLSLTDGFSWKQSPHADDQLHHNWHEVVTQQGREINYRLTLEPQYQKWLFTLDMGQRVQSEFLSSVYQSQNMLFLARQTLTSVVNYRAKSYLDYHYDDMTPHRRTENLYFPMATNPKTLALGRQWRQQYIEDQKIVDQAMQYFVEQPFIYTRRPPLMLKNTADAFLFEHRKGFCEHYASSFVLLMRAAGIPARVVTGYQGMAYNSVGQYYLVRQSNAHAWAEVWLNDRGWVRMDPTAQIPQHRIDRSIFDHKQENMDFLNLQLTNLKALKQQVKSPLLQQWFRQMKASLDTLRYHWNNWILSYDSDKQFGLLQMLGLKKSVKVLIMILMVAIFIIFAWVLWQQFLRLGKNEDALQKIYLQLIQKLNKQGLNVPKYITPLRLKSRSMAYFPQYAEVLRQFFDHYIQLRYAPEEDKERYCQRLRALKNILRKKLK